MDTPFHQGIFTAMGSTSLFALVFIQEGHDIEFVPLLTGVDGLSLLMQAFFSRIVKNHLKIQENCLALTLKGDSSVWPEVSSRCWDWIGEFSGTKEMKAKPFVVKVEAEGLKVGKDIKATLFARWGMCSWCTIYINLPPSYICEGKAGVRRSHKAAPKALTFRLPFCIDP